MHTVLLSNTQTGWIQKRVFKTTEKAEAWILKRYLAVAATKAGLRRYRFERKYNCR